MNRGLSTTPEFQITKPQVDGLAFFKKGHVVTIRRIIAVNRHSFEKTASAESHKGLRRAKCPAFLRSPRISGRCPPQKRPIYYV